MESTSASGGNAAQRVNLGKGWGTLAVCAALAALAVFGWLGLQSLPAAWSRDEYSHGYLIPAVALFLFLQRFNPASVQVANHHPGLAAGLGFVALALIFVGNVSLVADLATYGIILFLAALLVAIFGPGRSLAFWVPLAYLLFMLPLPHFVYLRLSISLQLISSEIGVWLISAFGVPVYLEGNVIDLGVYKLQVAEACSGLRYLFPLASFGFLFAALYRGPVWHKLLIFLSAVPITILMNSFRIGAIGVLVDRFGIEQADGFLHAFEGWIIFASCIAIMFLEVVFLQRLTGKPVPVADTLNLAMPPLARQWQAVAAHRAGLPELILAAMVLGAAVLWTFAPDRKFERIERETFYSFPLTINEWSGITDNLTQDVETVLGADDYFLAEYSRPAEKFGVGLFMAFYNHLAGGSGIHSPQVCLPVGGWEVSEWRATPVRFTAGGLDYEFQVNRAVVQKGLSRQLVWYWFQQNGRRITSSYTSKFYAVVDSIRDERTDASIIRLVTPIAENETEKDAEQRLQRLLEPLMPQLRPYIPD